MVPRRLLTFVFATTLAMQATVVSADESLHVQIDTMIEDASFGAVSPVATDSEFLRRIYLDLTGSIPPAKIARQFFKDQSTGKRGKIVDQLLNSPQHIRHLTNVMDVMLMERRAEKHVKNDEWRQYLYDSIATNKPWNQLAKEILGADGTDEKIRSATAFYFVRDGEPNLLTRDIGRLFFGMDLQCAQCHDHPLIASYYQSDYYGIYAFLSRGEIFTNKDKKVFFAEKANGHVSFKSVFTDEQDKTFPRLPESFEIDEPFFPQGEEYSVAPAKEIRPIPKYSRRAKLAELVESGSNRQFNRNIANRLWALMMGRGLVEPVDLHHADNPPSHPELLELLADQFASMNYDVKGFLRELALSKTYQRSLEAPPDVYELATTLQPRFTQIQSVREERVDQLKKLEQAVSKLDEQIAAADSTADAIYDELTKANVAIGEARKKSDEASKALAEAQQQLASKQAIARPLTGASASASKAAKLLPDEQEVATAAQQLKVRADKINAEVAAAEKAVQDKTPPANEANEALVAAQTNAEEINKRFSAARGQLREVEARLAPAASHLLVVTTQMLEAKHKAETADLMLQRATLDTTQKTLEASLQKQNTELESARSSVKSVESTLAKAQQDHAAARETAASMASNYQATVARRAEMKQVAALVGLANSSVEAASKNLPNDADVKTTLVSLVDRKAQLDARLAELAQLVATKQKESAAAKEQVVMAKKMVDTTAVELSNKQQQATRLLKDVDALREKLDSHRTKVGQAADEFVRHCESRFFTNGLKHLSPEQMSWSMMEATGYLGEQRRAGFADADKKLPIDPQNPNEAKLLAEREKHIEAYVYDKVKGNLANFVKLFGHGAGQPQADFFATVDQALYFSNSNSVLSWLNPSGNNLTARLNKLDEPSAIAEELYISVMTRRPTEQELKDVAEYLQSRSDDKVNALKEMVWALVTSTEFRFSH